MIQYLTFILVLILVIDRFYQVGSKKILYYLFFWKRLKKWLWLKVPKPNGDQWQEWRKKALSFISQEDLSIIKNSNTPYWRDESDWTEEEIENKRKSDIVFQKVRKHEFDLRNQWVKSQKPIYYYLIKLKLI